MKRWLTWGVAVALVLAACGGGGSETTGAGTDPGSDELLGQALFDEPAVGGLPGCITCHSLTPGTDLTGPSLASIGVVAASRVPGQSAEEYLRESILDPDGFVVEGWDAGTMNGWADVLSEAQVESLVQFMLEQ